MAGECASEPRGEVPALDGAHKATAPGSHTSVALLRAALCEGSILERESRRAGWLGTAGLELPAILALCTDAGGSLQSQRVRQVGQQREPTLDDGRSEHRRVNAEFIVVAQTWSHEVCINGRPNWIWPTLYFIRLTGSGIAPTSRLDKPLATNLVCVHAQDHSAFDGSFAHVLRVRSD